MQEYTKINSSAIESVKLIDESEQVQIKFNKSPRLYVYNVSDDYQLYSNGIAARITLVNEVPEYKNSVGSYINHLIKDGILVLQPNQTILVAQWSSPKKFSLNSRMNPWNFCVAIMKQFISHSA